MAKSNNQREAEDYKKQMAEMQARMAKMQKQLDKMRSEQAGVKPKTHLAALPKKSAKEIKNESNPESILASANAKQASVLSDSKSTTRAEVKQPTHRAKPRKVAKSSQTVKPTKKAASASRTTKQSTATRAQSASKPTQSRPNVSTSSSKATRLTTSSATKKATTRVQQTGQPVFPGSTSTATPHRSTDSSTTSSAVKSTATARTSRVSQTSAASAGTPKSSFAKVKSTSAQSTPVRPSSAVQPSSDSKMDEAQTADSQGKQIQQMDKSINDLLASVGMNPNDTQDLSQTYFYFISLIDDGKLVDQGRIITYNTKKMNDNGVVKDSDGAYYLDLEYLSEPNAKADALPLPKGYLVDLDIAKTLPDVVTKDPSSTDTMDSNIDLGGSTTIDMPKSTKDRGYYIPLSKLNGAKIPVHKVSETLENGSPHQAFVSQQPSQTMRLRHQPSSQTGNNPNDIHFDQPAKPKRRSTPQSNSPTHRSQPQRHHESSRTELRRERNHEQNQKQHVGLGHALGTMFGFGNRR